MASPIFLLLITFFTLATTSASTLDRRKHVILQRDTSDPPLLYRRDVPSFPRPFDTTVGDNFTASSCQAFFKSLTQAADISSCKAISLLLQTSTAFFQISKRPVNLTQTLDASCNVDVDYCDSIMNGYAVALKRSDRCGKDLAAQNPLVLQAYAGLLAYRPVYRAACLKPSAQQSSKAADKKISSSSSSSSSSRRDVSSGQYCLLSAFTNRSSPSSSYVYYLPLGTPLPGGAMPACNECLADTMQGYAAQAGNATQPLSRVYGDAVSQVDLFCGPTFVNATVPTVSAGHAAMMLGGSSRALLAVLAASVVWLVTS